MKSFTDWELLHELDSAIMSLDDCNTQGNVGEVLPGTTTPLTLTTVSYALDESMMRMVSGKKMSGLFLGFVKFYTYFFY